jgi:hypothetical protein
MNNKDQNTDRSAIKVEIDRLHQIESKVDSSIGRGITRRISELEKKLERRRNVRAA